MLIPKLALVCAVGVALGVFASWPAAAFSVAVVATALTFSQLRREVEELRSGID
jgi:hypothetical protein